MAPVDSAHQICLSILPDDVLVVVEGASSVHQKKSKIGDIIGDSLTTNDRTGKWTAAFNSPCRISLYAPSNGILIAVWGASSGVKKSHIGNVSVYISATRIDMAKRTPPFDSHHQISLNTPSNGIIIMGAAAASMY